MRWNPYRKDRSEQRRGETDNPAAPTSQVAAYTVYPTGYELVRAQDKPRWCLTVADAGDGWAIRRGARCLNYANQWEHEPPRELRDAGFLQRCRYNQHAALLRARRLIDQLDVDGILFSELVGRSCQQSRESECDRLEDDVRRWAGR